MRLLIVDDNATNLKLLRAQLEAEGHEVASASNGAAALGLLCSQGADGVISDILMPEMDGYRFCLEVRKDPRLRALPFVLYTSTYNSPADRQLAAKVGADAYISKPAPVVSILEALRAAAGRAPAPPEAPGNGDREVLRQYNEVLVRKVEDKNLELERSLARLSVMHQIDRAIIAGKPPSEIAGAVLPRMRELLGVPRASVSLIDADSGEAEWLATVGEHRPEIGPGARYAIRLLGDLDGLKRGEMQLVEVGDSIPSAIRNALRDIGVAWYAVLPMFAGDELIGSLNFGQAAQGFPEEMLEVAREVAAQLAIAIRQSRLDQRAREADAQYRMIFENVPLGITLTKADGRVVSGNQVMARMLGYDSVEEALRVLQHQAEKVYGDSTTRSAFLRRLREQGTVRDFEVELLRRDGSRFWASLDGRLVERPDGAQLVTIAEDITLRRSQEQRIARFSRMKDMRSSVNAAVARIREREALLDRVCTIAVEKGGFRAAWIAWHDPERRMLLPVASAGALEGFLDRVRLSTDPSSPVPKGIAARVVLGGAAIVTNDVASSAEIAFRDAALQHGFHAALHLPLKAVGEVAGVLILLSADTGVFDEEERALLDELAGDVSLALDSMRKSERLEYLAYYDALTGLPNRRLFADRLGHCLHARGGDPAIVAVVLLDLERFRRVNDTLGRQAGDELLRAVGARLQRQNESAEHLGADLFGLVLRGSRSASEVNRELERVMEAVFAAPLRVNEQELRPSCRAGIALHPADGDDADALLRNAEAALRGGKRSGERVVFYAPDMNALVAEALAIENKLRQAVERREFVLHYQPKVRLEGGAIVGAEALIRWRDPQQGLVPPGRFIPVLEETGMIVEVGRWAMQQAFADLESWIREGLHPPRIAVNVSSIQLQHRNFVDTVIGEIERGGDRPELLELEITESL